MNKKIYDKYKLNGFPNHFFSITATDHYNNKMEKVCAKLNPLATDLSFVQKIKRYSYIIYLDILDIIWYQMEKR